MAALSGLFAVACGGVPGGEEPAEEGGPGSCAVHAVSLRCTLRQRQICAGAHEVHSGAVDHFYKDTGYMSVDSVIQEIYLMSCSCLIIITKEELLALKTTKKSFADVSSHIINESSSFFFIKQME